MRERSLINIRQNVCVTARECSLVIGHLVVVVGDELVVALGGQVEGGQPDADGGQDEEGPGEGDEVEARVEVPAVPEAGVVVEEVGLEGVRRCAGWEVWGHTTMAMPAHCTTALVSSTPVATCHPAARRCTPPPTITTKDTSVHSSMTTAKEMRKPTVRHMLQKDGSFVQSDVRGKGTHLPVTAEQRLWSPYEYSRLPSCVY
jgi:hypothetical protein